MRLFWVAAQWARAHLERKARLAPRDSRKCSKGLNESQLCHTLLRQWRGVTLSHPLRELPSKGGRILIFMLRSGHFPSPARRQAEKNCKRQMANGFPVPFETSPFEIPFSASLPYTRQERE
jgi:hypothetical protein